MRQVGHLPKLNCHNQFKLFARIYNPLPRFHGDGTFRSPASGTVVTDEVTYPAGVWNSLHNARKTVSMSHSPPTHYIMGDFEWPVYEADHPTASGRTAATLLESLDVLLNYARRQLYLPSSPCYCHSSSSSSFSSSSSMAWQPASGPGFFNSSPPDVVFPSQSWSSHGSFSKEFCTQYFFIGISELSFRSVWLAQCNLLHLTIRLSDQSDNSHSFLLCLSLHLKPFSQTGKWTYHVTKFETFVNFKNVWYTSVTMGCGIYATWFKVKETPT